MKKIIPFVLCLLFICGCDPQSTYKKIIQNETNHSIWIVHYTWANRGTNVYAKDSSLIEAGKDLIIRNGSTYGNAPCILPIDDSLVGKITNPAGLIVTINLNNDHNWMRTSSGNSAKGYYVECRATIKNSDITNK